MKADQATILWGLAGVAGAYFLGKYIVKDATAEVGAAASKVGNAINPVSDENIFYRGVNSVGAAISGNENFNLGSWTYDILHQDEVKRLEAMSGPVIIEAKAPPEASTLPNSWANQTPGAPGTRAPVTKEQTGFFDYITGWFQ